MKYMNMMKKYRSMDLQVFAGDGGDDNGDDSGADDQDDDSDDDDGDKDDPDEKKFSQKDVDDAVKKRLAREKRKWQRDQQKKKPDGKDDDGDDGKGQESEDAKARKAAESKASSLEVKVACYEAGVSKDAVDDVAALARSYMAADEDLDLEDAIEKVVKKYPHFKKAASGADDDDVEDDDDKDKKKSWGQRQKGKGSKKMDGIESAFMKKNPGLKID